MKLEGQTEDIAQGLLLIADELDGLARVTNHKEGIFFSGTLPFPADVVTLDGAGTAANRAESSGFA